MADWSHPPSLVNQNVIFIDISHWRPHMALVVRLMTTQILANMAHMQYHLR